MLKVLPGKPLIIAVFGVLVFVSTAWASGATFVITGQGIELGEAKEVVEDGKPQAPRFHAKAELGKPFTLTAQGLILPRGGKAEPAVPDAGAWSFAEKSFKRLTPDKQQADKTTVVIRLEPVALGQGRVRFTGQILGYDHRFDVLVEVEAPKKE